MCCLEDHTEPEAWTNGEGFGGACDQPKVGVILIEEDTRLDVTDTLPVTSYLACGAAQTIIDCYGL